MLKKRYSKYEKEIEELAERYSNKTFLYISIDDIKQEIRNICYNAIESFDENKASIKTYLSKCINNRLNNLKRDLYFRYENICTKKRCPMYNIFIKECTSLTYKEICPYNKKNNDKMKKQIGIVNPVSICNISDEDTGFVKIDNDEKIIKNEIRDILISSSGEWAGVCFDVLIKYGQKYIKKNEFQFIKNISETYFQKA